MCVHTDTTRVQCISILVGTGDGQMPMEPGSDYWIYMTDDGDTVPYYIIG